MLKWLKSRLTYANVMVTLLAFLVLGGGFAWALATNTVGPRQIKPNAVRSPDIRNLAVKRGDIANNAINSAKVANGSLLGEDFAPGVIPGGGGQGGQGPQGPQGPQGVPGPPGPSGATNVTRRIGPIATIAADSSGTANASCAAGERAVGGDGIGRNGATLDFDLYGSFATIPGGSLTDTGVPNGWAARYINRDSNNSNSGVIDVRAYVVCAAP